jgi:hypothetical protein
MLFIVERSKQVVDFSVTLHFWHLMFTLFYSWTLPSGYWFLLMLISTILMAYWAEKLCITKELEPIRVKGKHKAVDAEDIELLNRS